MPPTNIEPSHAPLHPTLVTTHPGAFAVEKFLQLIEKDTSDPVHLRLLKVARATDPSAALERELARIIQELLA